MKERCSSAPQGHVIPYSSEADLTSLITGAWLRCGESGFPEGSAGILVSSDHTWNSVLESADGSCLRITTGFDDYGTWTIEKASESVRLKLMKAGGGSYSYSPAFSDTARARLDPLGNAVDYVKAPSLK